MNNKSLSTISRKIEQTFFDRTANSRARDRQARKYLPGGDTRSTLFYSPYPVYMQRGSGCRLYDLDGNEYLDFLNNYSALIHGHAHPDITRAACEEMAKGTIFGAPAEIQFRHASHLCERLPALDSVRYCNSGTEATMMALRAARAFTGKDAIIKMDGGYHGSHDVAEINLVADTEARGEPSHIIGRGVPACTSADVVIAPFNNPDMMESLIKKHKERLAAVIVEPIMGAAGLINPLPGYLRDLRELTRRFDILLIFDEVITFRLSLGGMQAIENIEPDLTTLGKIIGGGFPVGAFGGRDDVMAVFDPSGPRSVGHGGTFNGNNVTMAAGLVALEMYDQASVERLNLLGDRLRHGFAQAMESSGISGHLGGRGSVISLQLGRNMPVNAAEAARASGANKPLLRLLHLQLANLGVHSAPRGMYIISTPMSEKEVDQTIDAFKESLELIKPAVEEGWPHLMAT